MKQFVLTTKSVSGDDYVYFIEHHQEPTIKELEAFINQYAFDRDDEKVYENVENCWEIKDFRKIPD